jgi:hypothetical protein
MLEDYSNPESVYKKAHEMFGPHVIIQPSTRKTKKYMLLKPDGKWVHFGQYGMEDYTKHRNAMRREAFRTRNHKWAYSDPLTSSYLSFFLLW